MINFTDFAKYSTIYAAIKAFNFIGRGDKNKADEAAVKGIESFLNSQKFAKFMVKIGEGEMDEAPMLYRGQILGSGSLELDIAADPVDCTTLLSTGGMGSVSAITIAPKDSIIEAPDVYMEKIASCTIPEGVISLEETLENNIKNVAKFKKKAISDVGITLLERDRHSEIVEIAKKMGVKIFLVKDGDIMSVLETYLNDNIDFYIGTGGSPEGVIAASICLAFGGCFQGRFLIKKDANGVKKDKIYNASDLVGKNSITSISGITNGSFVRGIQETKDSYKINTLIFNGQNSFFENSINFVKKDD